MFSSLPNKYWIGLTDVAVEGEFVWPGNISLTDEQFRNGQPNDDESPPQDCVVGMTSAGHLWEDKPCMESHCFLCESHMLPNGTYLWLLSFIC